MSFKSILVHVDETERSKACLDTALRLARDFQSQIVGIYLVPDLDLSPSLAAILPSEVVERRLREAGTAQHDAEAAFRKAALAAGVTTIEWRAPAGPPIDAALAHARCADVFVVPQRDPSAPDFADRLLTTIMLSSGHPILVVPYIGARRTLGENVLIAWDGGREASRAIADALPILERARRVSVITVRTEGDSSANDQMAAGRLVAWLHQHRVEVAINRYDQPGIDLGEWLLSRVADAGSDLVVMGGYAHTRARELILGGVTRTLLHSMTVPVFMSH